MRRLFFPAAAVGALLLLALAVFGQVAGHGFIHLDDEDYVTRNVRVRAGLTAQGAAWAFGTTALGSWHPLTWLSLMLDVQLFGVDPGRMHLVSLALHGANGVLLFLLLLGLTGARGRSLLVSALFLAHPLHVESVAWIAERKDVLSTLLWLLGIAAYVRYVRRPHPLRLAPPLLLLALALMAKPMPVSFPLTLLLLDFWPLGRLRGGAPRAALLWEKAPFFALSAGAALLAQYAQGREGALNTLEVFPAPVRLGNALLAYGWYLRKALWPSGLAFFYAHPGRSLSWAAVAAAGLALAALTAAAWSFRRRRPWLLTGWLWYLLTLLPVIGIVQVGLQATADRYSYVPLAGVFLAAAWAVAGLAPRARPLRLASGAAVAAGVGALALAAHAQTTNWRDSRSLSEHAAAVAPSWLAFEDLGILAQLDGRSTEALSLLGRARALDPWNAQISYNIGWVHEQREEWEEAISWYRQAAGLEERDANIRTSLGVLLLALGRPGEAVPWLEQALALEPDAERAHSALGRALVRLGQSARAMTHLTMAVRIDPGDADAQLALARLLLAQGRRDEAAAGYAAVLRIRPRHREAQAALRGLEGPP